jgi:hypothetical protein
MTRRGSACEPHLELSSTRAEHAENTPHAVRPGGGTTAPLTQPNEPAPQVEVLGSEAAAAMVRRNHDLLRSTTIRESMAALVRASSPERAPGFREADAPSCAHTLHGQASRKDSPRVTMDTTFAPQVEVLGREGAAAAVERTPGLLRTRDCREAMAALVAVMGREGAAARVASNGSILTVRAARMCPAPTLTLTLTLTQVMGRDGAAARVASNGSILTVRAARMGPAPTAHTPTSG